MLRNIASIIIGLAVGAGVNMGLIMIGSHLVPAPPGVDVNDMQSLRTSIHLFEPKHLATPFLAHAIGTFTGALAAFFIAASHRPIFAYAIGVAFLAGGIAASVMIPAPAWFIFIDLVGAYLPMAWLAVVLGRLIWN
jgi:hypothetical protein